MLSIVAVPSVSAPKETACWTAAHVPKYRGFCGLNRPDVLVKLFVKPGSPKYWIPTGLCLETSLAIMPGPGKVKEPAKDGVQLKLHV